MIKKEKRGKKENLVEKMNGEENDEDERKKDDN